MSSIASFLTINRKHTILQVEDVIIFQFDYLEQDAVMLRISFRRGERLLQVNNESEIVYTPSFPDRDTRHVEELISLIFKLMTIPSNIKIGLWEHETKDRSEIYRYRIQELHC
jgi:hypothetical protein